MITMLFILEGYTRYFVTDINSGYNETGKGAARCGCWAHLRQKSYDTVPDHRMNIQETARDGMRFCDSFSVLRKCLKMLHWKSIFVSVLSNPIRLQVSSIEPDTLLPAHKEYKGPVTYSPKELLRFQNDGQIPLFNSAAGNAIHTFVDTRKNGCSFTPRYESA